MSILILIQLASIASLFNHLWFKTDFFAFYAKAFRSIVPKRVYFYLMIEEYFVRPPQDYIYSSYIEYFFSKKSFSNRFIEVFVLKLVSCPLCLTTWISLVSCLFLGNILYTGILFVLIRAIDSLLNFFLKVH
jgi:hypothetical protein